MRRGFTFIAVIWTVLLACPLFANPPGHDLPSPEEGLSRISGMFEYPQILAVFVKEFAISESRVWPKSNDKLHSFMGNLEPQQIADLPPIALVLMAAFSRPSDRFYISDYWIEKPAARIKDLSHYETSRVLRLIIEGNLGRLFGELDRNLYQVHRATWLTRWLYLSKRIELLRRLATLEAVTTTTNIPLSEGIEKSLGLAKAGMRTLIRTPADLLIREDTHALRRPSDPRYASLSNSDQAYVKKKFIQLKSKERDFEALAYFRGEGKIQTASYLPGLGRKMPRLEVIGGRQQKTGGRFVTLDEMRRILGAAQGIWLKISPLDTDETPEISAFNFVSWDMVDDLNLENVAVQVWKEPFGPSKQLLASFTWREKPAKAPSEIFERFNPRSTVWGKIYVTCSQWVASL